MLEVLQLLHFDVTQPIDEKSFDWFTMNELQRTFQKFDFSQSRGFQSQLPALIYLLKVESGEHGQVQLELQIWLIESRPNDGQLLQLTEWVENASERRSVFFA